MEKFLKQSKKAPKGGEKGGFFEELKRRKGIAIGLGTVGVLSAILFFFKGGKTTNVEIKSGLSPTQLETQLKEHLEPIYEGQKEVVKGLSAIEQQLKEVSQSLKSVANELKSLRNQTQTATAKVEGKKGKVATSPLEETAKNWGIPKSVLKVSGIGEIPKGEGKAGVQKGTEVINPIGHLSTVKVVEGRYGEQKLVYPPGYSPPTEGKAKGEEGKGKGEETKPTVYIPAGSIVEANLLYGFVAPEKGEFPPVVLLLEKPVWTPNDWYIPLTRCAIITKAQYNISMGLAILGGRGSILSCVLPNGKVVERNVNVAVGEETTKDGRYLAIMGLRGKEVWLTPKDLAIIGSIAFGEGMANAMQEGLTEQSLTSAGTTLTAIKQRGLYALLGGVKTSMNKFAEFWKKKYENKVPAIEVFPPKRAFVLFVQGVDLGITEEELNGEE